MKKVEWCLKHNCFKCQFHTEECELIGDSIENESYLEYLKDEIEDLNKRLEEANVHERKERNEVVCDWINKYAERIRSDWVKKNIRNG